ncbi:MAG: hypothetical protein K2X69_09445 [Silvanigrellaceae bacterium]|jgi:hypothetical protein|nr:hypothetical protein [Silvanigrellaceae bacterium]
MWNLNNGIYKKKVINFSYETLGIFFNYDSELVNNINYIIKNNKMIPISI